MESAISQRIRAVAGKYNLSITALSKRLGIAQQTLNRQIVGENAMSYNTVETILSCFPEISAEWLLRGEGEMIKGANCIPKSFDAKIEIGDDGCLKIRIK